MILLYDVIFFENTVIMSLLAAVEAICLASLGVLVRESTTAATIWQGDHRFLRDQKRLTFCDLFALCGRGDKTDF